MVGSFPYKIEIKALTMARMLEKTENDGQLGDPSSKALVRTHCCQL